MNTIEINLPNFPGFYSSILDLSECIEIDSSAGSDDGHMAQSQYDAIDWVSTNNSIAKHYLKEYIKNYESILKQFGISLDFVKVYSPKYYNYSTDKLVCKATFDAQNLIVKLRNELTGDLRIDDITTLIKHKFTSSVGFVSFYTNDVGEWLYNLLHNQIDTDNVVFELFLEFLTMNVEFKTFDCGIGDWYEFIEYNK